MIWVVVDSQDIELKYVGTVLVTEHINQILWCYLKICEGGFIFVPYILSVEPLLALWKLYELFVFNPRLFTHVQAD